MVFHMTKNNLLEPSWMVVELTREDGKIEVSTVPLGWIYVKDGRFYCIWPKSKARKYIKENHPFENTWDSYSVTKLSDTPMSYREALGLEKMKSTLLNVQNESEKNNSKKRKRKAATYTNYVPTFSSNEQQILPPLPKISTNRNDWSADTLSIKSIDLMAPPHEIVKKFSPKAEPPENPNTNHLAELEKLVNLQNAEIIPDADISSQILSRLEVLERKVTRTYILVQRIAGKLNAKKEAPVFNGIPSSSQPKAPSTFKKFRKLTEYDSLLKECEDTRKLLENIFYMYGGDNFATCIKQGLRRLMDDKLARKCSWLGQKNNFQVCNLKSMELLKNAVRRYFPNITDKEFAHEVSKWLRQVKRRYERKTKK